MPTKTKYRHELKYFINFHEYTYLKSRLESSLSLDKNALESKEYHIRSLYFDDMYQSAEKEKESGDENRKKYRIRIYNLEDKLIRLEKKIKNGSMTQKISKTISRDEYEKIFSGEYTFLLEKKDKFFSTFYAELRMNLLAPVVVVDYDREAYTYEAGNVRITFDKYLRTGLGPLDIFDEDMSTKHIFEDQVMILEIKYDDFMPSFIRNLLQISRHDISAISKFLLCKKERRKFYY